MTRKVLVLEDEENIRSFVVINLKRAGYEVVQAGSGEQALEKFHENPDVAVCILDVMLPGIDGYEVCRTLRGEGYEGGIIMLTARDEIDDKVKGLNIGADDYMTKPFATPELLARINVALRKRTRTEVREQSEGEVLRVKNLAMYTLRHEVMVGEESVELTKKEYDLLEMLLRNKRNVLTRDQILSDVWGYDYMGDTNVVDVYIRYLRQKLDDRFDEKYIYTMRGVGYVIKD